MLSLSPCSFPISNQQRFFNIKILFGKCMYMPFNWIKMRNTEMILSPQIHLYHINFHNSFIIYLGDISCTGKVSQASPLDFFFFLNQKFMFFKSSLPSAIFMLLPLSSMHTFCFKYLIGAGDCVMFKTNYINSCIFHIMRCVSAAVYKDLITWLILYVGAVKIKLGWVWKVQTLKWRGKSLVQLEWGEKHFSFTEGQRGLSGTITVALAAAHAGVYLLIAQIP